MAASSQTHIALLNRLFRAQLEQYSIFVAVELELTRDFDDLMRVSACLSTIRATCIQSIAHSFPIQMCR
jgi:hypothetical protein